jgi:hypothetical protein
LAYFDALAEFPRDEGRIDAFGNLVHGYVAAWPVFWGVRMTGLLGEKLGVY